MGKKAKTKSRIGRPPLPEGTHRTHPVRQVGRWSDADWERVRKAADAAGCDNVAAFCKEAIASRVARVLAKKN